MRDIELRIIARLQELGGGKVQLELYGSSSLQVHLGQFHGIEIDEWSASIARVAMFLADHQANVALEQITGSAPNRFPLSESAVIVNANALTTEWSEVCPMGARTYIMGNPPFYGARFQTPEQKADTQTVWDGVKGASELDFVANWYLLAAKQMAKHGGRAALVSTNSITQGEQPAIIWGELLPLGMKIDFAHRTFKWTNDASGQAAVHVVIIGFSKSTQKGKRKLWEYDDIKAAGKVREVNHINPYLVDAPDVLVTSRATPLFPSTPRMDFGSMPNDGGHLSDIDSEEAERIRVSDPVAAKYLRTLIGGREMLHNTPRYCLWLVGAEPSDLRNSSELSSRIKAVQQLRSDSKRPATQKLASRPAEFGEIRQPLNPYLGVPRISSENRAYVPIAMFPADVIATDLVLLIPDSRLETFGILSSRLFMVWNRMVSGRLKSDLRISATITYNNFPFPELDEASSKKLTASAQEVLDARANFPKSSLADLYDSASMPPDLAKAHMKLDADVLATYGLKPNVSDAEILEVLFAMYAEQSQASKS
jgi:hypothetical protein